MRDLFWLLTRHKSPITRKLTRWAEQWAECYSDYSYRMGRNGERRLLQTLSRFDFKTVFDVGANVGEWSGMARERFPNAVIHGFEISPRTFEILRKNLTGEAFRLNQFGLSDENGTFTYRDYGEGSGANTLVTDLAFHDKRTASTLVEAKTVRGDDYAREQGVDFIDLMKIDVEGAEPKVMAGFHDMLAARKVRCIQFEYGYVNGDAHFLMRDFYRLLEGHGYRIGKLWQQGVEFTDFIYWLNNFTSGPNFIAVRADDAEMIAALTVKDGPRFRKDQLRR